MKLAPIALFTYNRPLHTERTLAALKHNFLARESLLYIFADGPRNEAAREAVQQVRAVIGQVDGFKDVTVVEREANLGLAGSIISGVTELVAEHGKVIVLEDDLVTSPYFLRYMNDALALYEAEERVISIHGYVYPVAVELPETFFVRGADCWGWATWKRGWDLFEPDGEKLLRELRGRGLAHAFDCGGSYPYTRMLEGQVAGTNDSWAVRWHASAFLADRLTLYPGRSLVHNIGFDATGSHCDTLDSFDVELASEPVAVSPQPVVESRVALEAFSQYFRDMKPTLLQKIARNIRNRMAGTGVRGRKGRGA